MAAFPRTPIRCDFIKIILMEANSGMSPRDIPALESLLKLCLEHDLGGVHHVARPENRNPAGGAARFILRKHDFECARLRNIEILTEQHQQAQAA